MTTDRLDGASDDAPGGAPGGGLGGAADAPRPHEDDLPGDEREVTWITDPRALEDHVPQWRRLAEASLDENPFHEPAMFLPALASFAPRGLRIALVHAPRRKWPAGPRVLCGMFPIEMSRHFRGVPVRCATLWRYVHCFLGTPLVRASGAELTITALLESLRRGPVRAQMLHMPLVAAQGPTHELLVDYFHRNETVHQVWETYPRAMLLPRGSDEQYMALWPRKKRHEVNRLEKRLREAGSVAFRHFGPGENIDAWLDEFLRLEASGWKGRAGSALACEDHNARFLRSMATALAAEGRLRLLALEVDGRPIAMKLNVLGRRGAFSFKIAYDEQWARFSPGVLMERHNILDMHRSRPAAWMDSCAMPDHPMINTLWPDRRLMQTLLVSTGRAGGDFATSLLPLARWLKRMFKR